MLNQEQWLEGLSGKQAKQALRLQLHLPVPGLVWSSEYPGYYRYEVRFCLVLRRSGRSTLAEGWVWYITADDDDDDDKVASNWTPNPIALLALQEAVRAFKQWCPEADLSRLESLWSP